MIFNYHVHGLAVESDLPLPPLTEWNARGDDGAVPQVQVICGQMPQRLGTPEIDRRYYQATSDQVLMRAPGVGRLHITNGTRIEFELETPDRAADMAAHILGSGFAILHQQRGNVVLHASSVCIRDGAFLIAGVSGAGKSTIAAHLLEKAGVTLGDDVCVIDDAPDFMVQKGAPSTKLAANSLKDLPGYRDLPVQGTCQSGKAIIGTDERFAAAPLPLAGLVMIELADPKYAPTCSRLTPAQSLAGLREHTFRKRFVTKRSARMLLPKWSVLAQAVPIWKVTRPEARDTRAQIVDVVGRLMSEQGH